MDLQDAEKLVIEEGTDESGLVVAVRMGDIPDSARMGRLLDALEAVFHGHRGKSTLERELANALFGLSFHIQGEIDGRLSRSVDTREAFIHDEMVRMFLLIESIFEDEEMFE